MVQTIPAEKPKASKYCRQPSTTGTAQVAAGRLRVAVLKAANEELSPALHYRLGANTHHEEHVDDLTADYITSCNRSSRFHLYKMRLQAWRDLQSRMTDQPSGTSTG